MYRFFNLVLGLALVLAVLGLQLGTATAEPAASACDRVQWGQLDGDGTPIVPVDINRDGFIDCESDLELGA